MLEQIEETKGIAAGGSLLCILHGHQLKFAPSPKLLPRYHQHTSQALNCPSDFYSSVDAFLFPAAHFVAKAGSGGIGQGG
jgi:hypothetical protein